MFTVYPARKTEEAGPGSVMWFYTNHLHNNVLWNVSEPRMRKEERISYPAR